MYTPFKNTLLCSDSRLKPIFDLNIFARNSQIKYKDNPNTLFIHKFSGPEGYMGECTGIVTYMSQFLYTNDKTIRDRV